MKFLYYFVFFVCFNTFINHGQELISSDAVQSFTSALEGNHYIDENGSIYLGLTSGSLVLLNKRSEPPVAFGKIRGNNGNPFEISGANVTRNSTGRYTVTLNQNQNNTNYIIQIGVIEIKTRGTGNLAILFAVLGIFILRWMLLRKPKIAKD